MFVLIGLLFPLGRTTSCHRRCYLLRFIRNRREEVGRGGKWSLSFPLSSSHSHSHLISSMSSNRTNLLLSSWWASSRRSCTSTSLRWPPLTRKAPRTWRGSTLRRVLARSACSPWHTKPPRDSTTQRPNDSKPGYPAKTIVCSLAQRVWRFISFLWHRFSSRWEPILRFDSIWFICCLPAILW